MALKFYSLSITSALALALALGVTAQAQSSNTITISGKVTDFNNNPVDSSVVRILHKNFDVAYETYTDKDGNYTLKDIDKGRYMAMFAMRPEEYPRENKVSKEKMRLEYWAWNIIADNDLTINPSYDRLEIYGTTVYGINGGYPGLFIYFRPMSVTSYISYSEFLNKSSAEKNIDTSIQPENLTIKVYADDELLKINSIQTIKEYTGKENIPLIGYIVQVDKPKQIAKDKKYTIFKVKAENLEFNEKGESIYFYETKNYR